MYDRLTPLFRDVTDAQLVPSLDGSGYYKSAALVDENDPSLITNDTVAGTAPGVGAVSARIKRDAYGVPHIYSDTDAGVLFAAGYVEASDRSLLLDLARSNGVAGLIDIPGVPAIQLVLGLYTYKPTKKVLDEATAQQTKSIEAQGAPGRQLLSDIDVYLAGINLWYSQNRPASPPFTRTDIYALNALKSQFLGQGGGEEVANALVPRRRALQARRHPRRRGLRGPARALRPRDGDDDDAQASPTRPRSAWPSRAAWCASSTAASARRRPSSRPPRARRPRAPPRSTTPTARRSWRATSSSPAGKASQTGSPLFVGGPQIGFNYPGLTLEMDLHGPNIHVRGATSAPFPGYMLIGRGPDYAWTLTSADGDIIDTYAETLCGGSKARYLYKGKCRAMESVDAGTISKGGKSVHVTFRRTVHGPVYGYAKARGTNKQVALSTRRSSYGRETVDQLFFQQMTYGRVHSAKDFIRAAYKTPQTFNSFYASTNEAAFITSGLLPLRPKGVNPDLPVNGEGKYEWTGYLANSAHPQVINPSTGYIVNWNNKPAKDFPASDSRWNEQSLQRQKLLTGELGRRPKQTLATVLAAANAAATEDVRIVELWPTLKKMLDRGKAPNAATKQIADLLQAWHDAGGSRRDADHDGKIDDPGVPILDAAWKGLTDAGLCDRLGTVAVQAARGAQRALRPAARRPVRRLAPVHVEGPARAAGPEGRGRLPPALLRRRQREDLLAASCGRRWTRRASAWPPSRAPIRRRGARPRRRSRSPSPRSR